MRVSIILVFFFSLIFISCKKNTDSVIGPTRSVLIVKTWKLKSVTFSPALQISGIPIPISDATFLIPGCVFDDLYIYNADKTFVVDEGASKCSNTDPQIKTTGNWSLNSDETILNFNYNKTDISGKILDLTTTNLQISAKASEVGSIFLDGSGYSIDPKSTSVATLTFTAN